MIMDDPTNWLTVEVKEPQMGLTTATVGTAPLPAGKDEASSQVIWILVGGIYGFAFYLLGFLCIQIMTQLISVMVQLYVGVVLSLTRALIVAVMSPFIVLGTGRSDRR